MTGEGKRRTDYQRERIERMASRRNLRLVGDQGSYWLVENGLAIMDNTTLCDIETYLLSIPVNNA
jgi:hypothetical protein